jgi:hypothetical protein
MEIAQEHPDCHDALSDLLGSESQLVAAYALLTLELMGSDIVANLPAELLDRRQQITLLTGSFKNSVDLGGLARQVQKRARVRRDRPSPKDQSVAEDDKKA